MSQAEYDICLNCGVSTPSKLWGADCDCNAPEVVHQFECIKCDSVIGYMMDDDYCGPEKLICPNCMPHVKPPKPKET